MHSKVRAFTGNGAERRAERAGHFFKALTGMDASKRWCVENGIKLDRATNESGNTFGGFLVPEDVDTAILSVRETVGAFRAGCEIRPTRSDSKVNPRRIGGLTANFVSEGAPIPESSFQLDAVEASLRKLAVLARGSAELFEDSAPDLGQFIASEIGYAIANVEDDCGFNGDGTSAFRGITGLGIKLQGMKSAVAAASGHNTFATIDAADITNLMAGILAAAVPGARWYISQLGFALTFCRLAALTGGLTTRWRADGEFEANFLGFPVSFSGKLPNSTTSLAGKPMLYFGNLAMSSLIVERNDRLVINTSFDRGFETDQVLVRGHRREDIINHTVGDANTCGPIAMLVGTA